MSGVLNTTSEDQVRSFTKGKQFRFSALEDPPWVLFRRSQNGPIVEYTGFCFEIINALRDFYNFSYEVVTPADNAYGTETNGSWNGMIAMILNNKSDMGVSPFYVTLGRRKAVDFTEIFDEDPNALLIPVPMEDSRLLAFIKPFHLLVWLGLCLLIILVPIILWLLTEIFDRYRQCPDQLSDHRRPPNYSKFVQKLQSVFAVLVSQPVRTFTHNHNWTIKATLIMAVWSLSAIVLINAYTGVMISFISVPKLHPLVKSLDELPNSPLQWVVQRGMALESLFLEAKGGIYYAIGNGLRLHPDWWVNDPIEGATAVIAGKSAYINGRSTLDHLIKQDYLQSGKCRLSTSKEEFFKGSIAFVAAKGSPLASIFNRKILIMSETGLIQHWKQVHWPNNKQCKDTQHNVLGRGTKIGPKKLSLKDLQSSFFIWSIGALLALITFFIELILDRITR